MVNKKRITFNLACAVFGLVSLGWPQGGLGQDGQGTASQSGRSNTLLQDLDDLGHTLFGGILPNDENPKPRNNTAKRSSSNQQPNDSDGSPNGATRTMGGSNDDYSTPSRSNSGGYGAPNRTQNMGASRSGGQPSSRASSVAGRPGGAQTDNATLPGENDIVQPGDPNAPAPNVPGLRPLHERLSAFRRSAFADSEQGPAMAAGNDNTPAAAPAASPSQPKSASPNTGTQAAKVGAATAPTNVPSRESTARPTPAKRTTTPTTTAARLDLPPPPTQQAAVPTQQAAVPATPPSTAATAAEAPVESRTAKQPPATSTATRSEAAPATAMRKPSNVLFVRKSPLIAVQTIGPPRIMVGRESTYEIAANNAGEIAAEDVVVFINLPVWAEVSDAETTAGSAQPLPGETGRMLQWRVGQLAASGKERLLLRIIPRESRPIDLAVRWECKPTVSQTMIEVQEARLSMRLEGPHEVFFGKKELFTLKLANTGNGDAENVAITLFPLGPEDNRPATHKIGLITAGEEKTVDVELTPRQPGNLQIKIEARGDDGTHAELAHTVLVHRAAIRIETEAPQVQYVGALVAYKIRISNGGNAPARNIKLSANIPTGAKYISGVEGSRLDASGTKVQWVLTSLAPTLEQTYILRCNVGNPGINRLEVVCTADDDLAVSAVASTRVEAMADLVLDMKDPAGPIPVGEDAIYELRVRNRGTKAADEVEVLGFFSQGIEPVSTEGGLSKTGPGQVAFAPIPTIAPGAAVVLQIHARAEVAGNHIFRAEVHCKPLGTRLVSEQTTHYYVDGNLPPPTAVASPQQAVPPPVARTAERREMLPPPPQGQPNLMPMRR
jgi:uncharacterized repeat protein (TIGR01451 family)